MIKNSYKHGTKTKPQQIVLLLHGLGSNGQDLISLAPYFAQKLPDAVFISPDAPFHCDMVPPGYPNSFQWFSLQTRDPSSILKGIQTAAPLLENFIEATLKDYNLSANKLALVGFSQGTMMSLYAGPRYKDKIAGVLGYSGALFWDQAGADKLNKVPVHLIHGEADDVVPVEAYHEAQNVLKSHNFTVTGYTQPRLTHSIDDKGILSGSEFLAKVLL